MGYPNCYKGLGASALGVSCASEVPRRGLGVETRCLALTGCRLEGKYMPKATPVSLNPVDVV